MRELYKTHLFGKHILVYDSKRKPRNAFPALFAFANLLSIKIAKGKRFANKQLIAFAASRLGVYVPEPFYRGFPNSVKKLSKDELLFDQLLNYFLTYDLDDFTKPRYSLFEEDFSRTAFKENAIIKTFDILTEKEAEVELELLVKNYLSSSRPLNDYQYTLVKEALLEYNYTVEKCPCKDTVIRLIIDTENTYFADLLTLPDFIKVVENLNYYRYGNKDVKKLKLKNKDRVFLSNVLDRLLSKKRLSIKPCFEKQQKWCGCLHHIHYKPKTAKAQEFIKSIRYDKNQSTYSAFEKAMSNGDIPLALSILLKEKGSSAIMRNLNYLLSRCDSDEKVKIVMDKIKSKNNIVLIQLLLQYANYKSNEGRNFKFTKFGNLVVHSETKSEVDKRKSVIDSKTIEKVVNIIRENLKENLKGKLPSVYVGEDMKKIAIPLQEGSSQGGFGTLPKGSKLPMPDGKKIRVFTYWEKVNDIDLSIIGLDENYKQYEFSWRTMAFSQSDALTFSGDQTSGYNGGSEYFDIELDTLKKQKPKIRYYVICDNVFSGVPFSKCFCKAGYMLRDMEDSGKVFEPKTVTSAYFIDCDSTFAYMFAIDVFENQIIWLNVARDSSVTIAGTTKLTFLVDYLNMTDVINMYDLFTMLSAKIVSSPLDADYVVTDEEVEIKEGATLIRSYDTDKILPLING